jgi:hypothetical protein
VNYFQAGVSTDQRRALVLSTNPNGGCTLEDACFFAVDPGVTWRPASNISFTLGPGYSYEESRAQYVRAVDDPTATAFFGRRYVFADLTQRTVSMDTRVAVTFTPSLTFELYVQPFIASADYARYKEFAAPRELTKRVYGVDVGTIAPRAGDAAGFVVDPDGDGPAGAFDVDDPSFTLRSLRGNAVVRWEYRPGSTLFLVWTLNHQDALADGDLDLTRDVRGVFNGPLESIFLVKLNYWFGF